MKLQTRILPFLFVSVAFLGLVVYNGTSKTPIVERNPAAYFQGATFRKASAKEAEKAIQVLSCSGNFLKSSDGNLYVMTARHCLNFIDSCYDIKIKLHSIENDKASIVDGSCREIKIDDKEHDIVVFRAELFKDNLRYVPNEELRYCLESDVLPPGEIARVVHFPNFDPDKIGAPKTTVATVKNGELVSRTPRVSENCAIISEPVWCAECRDKQTVQWTNCPLFEGSSGSGLISLKSSCIAGVAHAADPSAKEYSANEKGASVAVVPLFVRKHRKILEELKIEIENTTAGPAITTPIDQKSHVNSVR